MPDLRIDYDPNPGNFSGDENYVPTSLETFGVFQGVLGKGVRLSADYIGLPVEGPSVMSLERSVHVSGSFKGFFVVRAHRKLAPLLLEKSAAQAVVPSSGEEAFDQLVERFCSGMMKSFWNPAAFKPLLIHPCNPRFWPKRTPVSACALLVERYPVEIRFWMERGLFPEDGLNAGEKEK